MTRAAPVLLFVGFWLLLLGGGRSSFLRDPGTFWHTTTGDMILNMGFVAHDPYTFTFAGTPWIPYQWLGEVIFALVHRVAGLDGLLTLTTAGLAALFAWLTVRMLRTGLHPIAVIALAGLILATSASHFHVRPHIATMICLSVLMAKLGQVERESVCPRVLWVLIPLFTLWTNLHGGMLGGLTTLGLAGLGWVVWWGLGRPSPVARVSDLVWLAVIGLVCGLTAFANPYGRDLPRTWLDIMSMPQLPLIIKEHSATNFREPSTWPFIVLALVYLALLAGTPWRSWRVSWLLPLFWLVQSYARVRHAPLFALSVGVVFVDLWPQTRWAGWLATRRPDFYDPAGRSLRWGWLPLGTVAGLVGLAIGLQANGVTVPVIGNGWARLDPQHWPMDLVDPIREHEPPQGQTARVFNDYIDGGFLEYHAPRYRVFVDDRCEVFGGDWLARFVDASRTDPAPALTLWQTQYGEFDFALTRSGTAFDGYFRARPDLWQPIREGAIATFYKRKSNPDPVSKSAND